MLPFSLQGCSHPDIVPVDVDALLPADVEALLATCDLQVI
jgi:hypothetical protein